MSVDAMSPGDSSSTETPKGCREVQLGDRTALLYGALLHDVGKVIYRGLSEQGTHSKLGANFLSKDVAPRNVDYEGPLGRKVIEQVRYHHKKEMAPASLGPDSLAYITYFADNISAGADRKNEGDEDQRAFFDRKAKLEKIFNILGGRHDHNTVEHDDYNRIRQTLLDNLSNIPISSEYQNSMLGLLEATVDKVPSSTNRSELIDVSLYDHAKTTAGIALCIYDYLYEQKIQDYRSAFFNRNASQKYYDRPMFLLCSCDMSGIQDFIYNISGDGALKQLRARSVYLELLMEHAVDELLERLHLCRANLLYAGGGGAYLILPNTSFAKAQLQEFSQQLTQWFVDRFRNDLYLAIAYVECSANDLANKGGDGRRYGNLYRTLATRMSQQKAQRYSANLISRMNFEDEPQFDHSRECVECHRSDTLIDADGKCEICSKLGKISRGLVDKNVFVISENDNGLPLPFGAYLSVWTKADYQAKKPQFRRVYTKNAWDTGLNLATHIWMGEYTAPTNNEGISSYAQWGETLGGEDSKYGIQRLGVLRADVDNLGMTFAYGIPADKASISRSATLSRAVNYFFKYRLNEVLSHGEYRAQIIYSGGDDIFLVGNWNDIIHAATDIRKALSEYTGNDSLTISAGIGIYNPKYPIARMASEVGDLEDSAKLYKAPGSTEVTKNALALWSDRFVFGWQEFMDEVVPGLAKMQEIFDQNQKGKAFIYRLLALLRSTDQAISAPRLAYLLARSFEDSPNGDEISQELYSWAMDSQRRIYLVAALEWYVYETRERG